LGYLADDVPYLPPGKQNEHITVSRRVSTRRSSFAYERSP
jgi:hypothetical protein